MRESITEKAVDDGMLLRKLSKLPTWIEAACAVALVIIAGTYTHYAGRQLDEMRKSADAAKSAAETAAETLERTLRPRITIGKLSPQGIPIESGKLALNLNVFNYGPILARNIRVSKYENISDLAHASPKPYSAVAPREYPKLLGPNVNDSWGIYGEKALSNEEIQLLARTDNHPLTAENGQRVATFSVLIEYQGDSEEVHHTETCILYTLPPQQWWSYCPWTTRVD